MSYLLFSECRRREKCCDARERSQKVRVVTRIRRQCRRQIHLSHFHNFYMLNRKSSFQRARELIKSRVCVHQVWVQEFNQIQLRRKKKTGAFAPQLHARVFVLIVYAYFSNNNTMSYAKCARRILNSCLRCGDNIRVFFPLFLLLIIICRFIWHSYRTEPVQSTTVRMKWYETVAADDQLCFHIMRVIFCFFFFYSWEIE